MYSLLRGLDEIRVTSDWVVSRDIARIPTEVRLDLRPLETRLDQFLNLCFVKEYDRDTIPVDSIVHDVLIWCANEGKGAYMKLALSIIERRDVMISKEVFEQLLIGLEAYQGADKCTGWGNITYKTHNRKRTVNTSYLE